jgi:hypothetical protein
MNELIHSTNIEVTEKAGYKPTKAACDVPALDLDARHIIPDP